MPVRTAARRPAGSSRLVLTSACGSVPAGPLPQAPAARGSAGPPPARTGWRARRARPGHLDDHELLPAMEPQRHRHEPELSLRRGRAGPGLVQAGRGPAPARRTRRSSRSASRRSPPADGRKSPRPAAARPPRRASWRPGRGTTSTAARHRRHSPARRANCRPAGDLRQPARRTTQARLTQNPGLPGPGRCQARRAAAVPPLPRPPPGPEANQVTRRRPDERRRRPPGDLDGTAMPARPQDDTSNHPAATGSPASSGSRINENNHRG